MNEKALIGCLLGTAIGDSVGLPYEGLRPKRIAKWLKPPLRQKLIFGRGMISDDTEQTCLVAKALITAQGDVKKFEKQLAWSLRWWFLNLPAGTGLATAKACIKLCLGFPPRYSGIFSAGNGAAMRCAIIGVVYADDVEKIKTFVFAATRLTHTDPKAYFGALTVALAARQTVQVETVSAQDFLHFHQDVFKNETSSEYEQLLEQTINSVVVGEDLATFAASLGCQNGITGYVYHTVPCVIHCWLRHQHDFSAGLEEIIRAGGDTDTTGAIYGAIAGTQVGADNIPQSWVNKLTDYPRNVRYIHKLGQCLAQFVEGNSCKPPFLMAVAIFPRNLIFLMIVLLHGLRRLLPPY